MFTNREEAGRRLAERLSDYRGDPSVVILALPRGGVAVGYRLSLLLGVPLDVLITRKIGAPGNPEYALGAICETGAVFWNQEALSSFSLRPQDMDRAVTVGKEEIARRVDLYRQGRPLRSLTDRTVILLDDGLATGATFLASIAAIRRLQPGALIGAIPVGPPETLGEVARRVDKLIVLLTPDPFYAVGNFYVDFAQMEDSDVLRYLKMANEALPADLRNTAPSPPEETSPT
ncbi:MAG TPA: phosphoribosyltransferase [Nitrospiraceae bacterium]|nr:phosphoribosyltransferase [Nitrospiraceae bacterium]